MRVCVYTPLNRLAIPSGVPRHIVEMVNRLIADDSLDISLLAARADIDNYLKKYAPAWTSLPITTFPRSVGYMHRIWALLNHPAFETMGGSADWLYLPADGYVPTRHAKLAVTIHDVYKLEPPVPFDRRLRHYNLRLRHKIIYKRVAQKAERILTVSKFSADRIMHHLNVPSKRIEIVSNGVSPAFFNPSMTVWDAVQARLALEPGKFFVYAGGLKAKKNASGIVRVWSEFEKRHPDYRLVILGHHDGAVLQAARQALKTAIYPQRMIDEEMAAMLQQSTALFFPSFYEGFGMPILEAMAAGTLAVVSDIPALREVGDDIPLYFDPHDPPAMLRSLEITMIANHERATRIAAGRAHASKFRWEDCFARLRAVLN